MKRFIETFLLLAGIGCLSIYIVVTVHAHIYQSELEETFDSMVREPEVTAEPADETPLVHKKPLQEGDLVGRLQIPRLDLSVMVLEGVKDQTLRLGAGHIPGTALPGSGSNSGIAAHRDSFFRALSRIKENDRIEFETPEKKVEYRVVSTQVVDPDDVEVLNATDKETLTLVTCYPFYYVGPAPKRFIVKATAD